MEKEHINYGVLIFAILIACCMSLTLFFLTDAYEQKLKIDNVKEEMIDLENKIDILNDANKENTKIYNTKQAELDSLNKELTDLKKQLEDLRK